MENIFVEYDIMSDVYVNKLWYLFSNSRKLVVIIGYCYENIWFFGIKLMVFYWVNFYGLNVVELILGGDDFVKYLWFFIYLVRKDCLIRFM